MTTVRRSLVALGAAALAAASFAATTPATAAVAPNGGPPPIVGNPASVVRATALPTAQINGIATTQVIIGDTVYVGGTFSKARPAGVAVGGPGEVERDNLLAYSLSTGQLVASFAPDVNNTVQALAASPDGTRLYVGGLFTSINGTPRYRIASFDTSTGQLVAGFKPIPNYVVAAITATNNAVYFGGKFNNVDGVTRGNLAAVQADTGKLLAWNPVADATVQAVVFSPDRSKLIVAGNFANLNGVSARGLGSVNVSNGATQPFAANQTVYSYGTKAAFLSLTTDGKAVYATSYNYGGTGNLEGTVSANPSNGKVNWIEDCHGDTYSAWSNGTTVYTVGHAHNCATIGGFPQVAADNLAHRAVAFTAAVGGTIQTNTQAGYANLAGNPAPSIRQWFPDLKAGTGPGAHQAAWSVTGSGPYLVMAGEFPIVNGTAQQGLVRFATVPISPNTMGPQVSGSASGLAATPAGRGALTVSFPANWDRDDYTLTYKVTRDTGVGTASKTIKTVKVNSTEWSRPTTTFTDAGLTPGQSYRYRLFVNDPAGNTVASLFVTVTAPSS